MMLTTNLVELIASGTSGWSNARVQDETTVSMADESAETEEIRTYVRETSLTSLGTNAPASFSEAATKMTVIIAPSTVCTKIMVYDMLSREDVVRVDLSPTTSHADLGRLSLRTCAITPM